MITGRCRFNLYLLLALAALVAGGCRTHKHDKSKDLATLRIHLESSIDDDTSRTEKVPIYRASPVDLTVDKEPFLTEAHVASAKVVDVLGGYDLQIQLNRQGSWLLQGTSASNPGKHYAIFSQFGEKGKQSRWLAAPIFSRVISAGIIQFTPDASREEADEIARGLNNIAKKNESNDKW
jgi:preprotein translocase subunit SecD